MNDIRIMLVDDNAELRRTMREHLQTSMALRLSQRSLRAPAKMLHST